MSRAVWLAIGAGEILRAQRERAAATAEVRALRERTALANDKRCRPASRQFRPRLRVGGACVTIVTRSRCRCAF